MFRCGGCGAVYAHSDERPKQCIEHICPLDCGYNVDGDRYVVGRKPDRRLEWQK
jgi:hypothetical protein